MESNPAKLAASKLVEDLMSGIACRSDGPSISPAAVQPGIPLRDVEKTHLAHLRFPQSSRR